MPDFGVGCDETGRDDDGLFHLGFGVHIMPDVLEHAGMRGHSGILVAAVQPFINGFAVELQAFFHHVLQRVGQLVFPAFPDVVVDQVLEFPFQVFPVLEEIDSDDGLVRDWCLGFLYETGNPVVWVGQYHAESAGVGYFFCPDDGIFVQIEFVVAEEKRVGKGYHDRPLQRIGRAEDGVGGTQGFFLMVDAALGSDFGSGGFQRVFRRFPEITDDESDFVHRLFDSQRDFINQVFHDGFSSQVNQGFRGSQGVGTHPFPHTGHRYDNFHLVSFSGF